MTPRRGLESPWSGCCRSPEPQQDFRGCRGHRDRVHTRRALVLISLFAVTALTMAASVAGAAKGGGGGGQAPPPPPAAGPAALSAVSVSPTDVVGGDPVTGT